MKQSISTMQIRHKLGEILNKVELRHDQFIIERKGKAMAVLIPMTLWNEIQGSAENYAKSFLENRPSNLSEEEAMRLANEIKKPVFNK
jgi:prevent-host-death family protein